MDSFEELEKSRIGIFGYGAEGQSLFNFLVSKGCSNIKIFDEKAESKKLENGSSVVSGKFEDGDYADLDVVFRSPGIKVRRLRNLLPATLRISSPTNLFFENCKATTIGITGTKGKSTTALLIAKLLESNDKKVFIVGNIGNPMLDVLNEASEDSYCVVELSSFQLQDLEFKPDVAVILPILIDHLDYHEDEKEYVDAKRNIISDDQELIVCDLNTSKKLSISGKTSLVTYTENLAGASCNISGGGFECRLDGKTTVLDNSIDFAKEKKIPVIDLMAAYAFGCARGLKFDLGDFQSFEKLPLRVELVAVKRNVKFYNDSASTNPLSTMKAMEMMNSPYVLILGGSAKGVGFEGLAKMANNDKNLQKVFLYGDTAGAINEQIQKAGGMSARVVDRLSDVFKELEEELSSVEVVLFSPACASFDQYKNYKDRGRDFNTLVETINE